MAMKYYILPIILLTFATLISCTDDLFVENSSTEINYRGEPVDAYLDITVGELAISMETRADEYDPYEDTEAERWVNDLWVFQFDATDKTAIDDPIYLTIDDQETLKNVPITLSDNNGKESIIYVVTNIGDNSWGDDESFNTIDGLLAGALPTREPIFVTNTTTDSDLSIPMEGNSGVVTVSSEKTITVPVERMYAKIMIDPTVNIAVEDVDDGGVAETSAEVYSLNIGGIPTYCRVGTLYNGDDSQPATYPENTQWISRGLTEELDTDEYTYRYIVYIPENLQGQNGSAETSKIVDDDAPSNATYINTTIAYIDEEGGRINYPYTFYPGANTTNDYNIKRNNVYRVKLDITALSMLRVPSANCLFAYAGETIAFFPYYRIETGGGYDFEDYLDPTGVKGEKIDHLSIIWQTQDCIGDNSDVGNPRVYLVSPTGDDSHNGYEKIYVKTGKEGNALIGAYNSNDEIIWSWHIWVRTSENGDPTDESRAIVYYTYYWDETGIYSDDSGRGQRIPGYQLMTCNIGALQDEPNWGYNTNFGSDSGTQTFQDGDGIVRTFGMLYQWGRKDPFPPMISTKGDLEPDNSDKNATDPEAYNSGYYLHDYNDEHTGAHYGNDNKTVVHKTSYDKNGPTYTGAQTYSEYLFYSHIAETDEGMGYAIANPTVFLCGANEIALCFNESATNGVDNTSKLQNNKNNYVYGGAWSNEDHDNREWGGLEPNEATMMHYSLGINDNAGNPISLWDNYADDTGLGSKSIFDPCPYGWRVAPGELWIGFTESGTGPNGRMQNVSFDYTRSCLLGMTMYLGQSFRTEPSSWFPCQGFRLPDGSGYRVGACGNYVNANTDLNDRINIVHLHYSQQSFKQFETQIHYTAKSTGNPLRCVRDTH